MLITVLKKQFTFNDQKVNKLKISLLLTLINNVVWFIFIL